MADIESWQSQYASPDWKALRVRIMAERGRRCETCGTEEGAIQIHHKFYVRGKKIWEYPDHCFVILCIDCHERWHRTKDALMRHMSEMSVSDLTHLESILAMRGASNMYAIAAAILGRINNGTV